MFSKVCLLVLLVCLVACSPREAFESYCPHQLAPASLEVETMVEPPTVNNTLTRAQISEGLRQQGTPVEGAMAMGATAASLEQNTSVQMRSLSFAGMACGAPQAKVRLHLPAPVVQIADVFKPGTCRYDTVRMHELMHVQAYEDVVAQTAQHVKEAFERRHPPGRIQMAGSEEELDSAARQELDEWLVPTVSAEYAKVRSRNRAIDNVAEYTRLTLACAHEPLEPEPKGRP